MRNQLGEKNNNAKITAALAGKIKGLHAKGVHQWWIARITGVCRPNVWCIIKGVSWVDVEPDMTVEIPEPDPAPVDKRCPHCGETKLLSDFPPHNGSRSRVNAYCRPCQSKRNIQRNKTQRLAAIERFGGKCECCGEVRVEFLAFDHVKGGGSRERKQIGQHGVIRKIVRDLYKSGEIRLLCHNCNLSIGFYGYCPHSKEANMADFSRN